MSIFAWCLNTQVTHTINLTEFWFCKGFPGFREPSKKNSLSSPSAHPDCLEGSEQFYLDENKMAASYASVLRAPPPSSPGPSPELPKKANDPLTLLQDLSKRSGHSDSGFYSYFQWNLLCIIIIIIFFLNNALFFVLFFGGKKHIVKIYVCLIFHITYISFYIYFWCMVFESINVFFLFFMGGWKG